MPFCSNCGKEMELTTKFCTNCGTSVGPSSSSIPTPTPAGAEEKSYFKGEGELIVKRTKHKGAGAKVGSWLVFGPIGYVAFGRDKTRKSKAEGTLVVTNKAIYCAGNDYPFDKILSITKEGRISKSLVLTFDRGEGGGEQGGVLAPGMTVEMEIKTKDIDALMRGLEQAKMAHVKF
jgi:hypothetical protein